MSVHTSIHEVDLTGLLKAYDLGELQHFTGISEGITNTIYRVTLSDRDYVLTLFENLMAEELSFFVDLMHYLEKKKFPCPRMMLDRQDNIIQTLYGKPAILSEFLPGKTLEEANDQQCQAIGSVLAHLHLATGNFRQIRKNPHDVDWHVDLSKRIFPYLDSQQKILLERTLSEQMAHDYRTLPKGICHMDLFMDNVLFEGNQLTGVLDFYFACYGYYVLDLAITLCACSITGQDIDLNRGEQVLIAYQNIRTLSLPECLNLRYLQRYAALHFWLTRLRDKYLVPPKAGVCVKEPREFEHLLIALN